MKRSSLVVMILMIASLGAVHPCITIAKVSDEIRFQTAYDPSSDFEAHTPGYHARRRERRAEVDRLQDDLQAQQQRGRKGSCTRQVLLEANWLIGYTSDFARIDRKLADLRARLAAPVDPHRGQQVEADGSFACCTEEWFLKLDRTTDRLVADGFWLANLEHPLRLLERINSPEKLCDYLDSVLVSDVRTTGVDRRYELNIAVSDLARFILWQGTLKELPTGLKLHPGLRTALIDYMDRKWQGSESGYWGAWYRTGDGTIIRTSDLSATFHLVSYRNGQVERWPEIVRTTLAIKGGEYPYGWLEDGAMSNHHNYDVVKLFRLGWPHADATQHDQIRSELTRMVRFCRDETLQPDGSFRMRGDEATLGSNFYFGIAFLNEVGFFSKSRFWSDEPFPDAGGIRDRIEARLVELNLDDPEAKSALNLLRLSRFR